VADRLPRAVRLAAAALVAAGLAPGTAADPEGKVYRSLAELRSALATARPGARLRVAAGTYEGGIHVEGLRGTEAAPIVLEAADPANPPLFRGGGTGLHLTDPEHVLVRDLSFAGQTGNGVNVDDGGTPATPAHHVVLRGLEVRDVGPEGNCDGIKLSGVNDFRVEASTVERWGTGGSAVDMVGCRRGTIERCTFRHRPEATGASGVQAKGGSRDVGVLRNRFEHAGGRAVNVGGSTGLEYFRPPLAEWKEPAFEAKDVRVEGNTFLGGQAAAAFVGVDGAVFRFNTVHHPGRWALRVLQETRDSRFVPSRRGVVSDNLFAFRSDRWASGGVNVGPDTDVMSFRFERNVWFCADDPARTKELVRLPVAEVDGTYGKDPLFVDEEAGDLRLRPGSPAAKHGADAYGK
jgi:hypothetical protein